MIISVLIVWGCFPGRYSFEAYTHFRLLFFVYLGKNQPEDSEILHYQYFEVVILLRSYSIWDNNPLRPLSVHLSLIRKNVRYKVIHA